MPAVGGVVAQGRRVGPRDLIRPQQDEIGIRIERHDLRGHRAAVYEHHVEGFSAAQRAGGRATRGPNCCTSSSIRSC